MKTRTLMVGLVTAAAMTLVGIATYYVGLTHGTKQATRVTSTAAPARW